eukprot:6356823-Pyramimonas_sp.AAC.1
MSSPDTTSSSTGPLTSTSDSRSGSTSMPAAAAARSVSNRQSAAIRWLRALLWAGRPPGHLRRSLPPGKGPEQDVLRVTEWNGPDVPTAPRRHHPGRVVDAIELRLEAHLVVEPCQLPHDVVQLQLPRGRSDNDTAIGVVGGNQLQLSQSGGQR